MMSSATSPRAKRDRTLPRHLAIHQSDKEPFPVKLSLLLFFSLLTLVLVACAPVATSGQPADATPTPGTLTVTMASDMPADHAMQRPGMGASAAMTHTMPMTSSMPADHALHHPGMGASAAVTHTMPMAGGMEHTARMNRMSQDMETMLQRMAEMHASMAMTHTTPMTHTMPMMGGMEMTREQHMGGMMTMMGRMMIMMGEMHMMGGMDHGSMGGSMCDMMGGQGCEMMGSMDHGSMGSDTCAMMGAEGCEMMGSMGGMDHGSMGAGLTMTATQALTATAPAGQAVTAPLGTPDTRTSEAGGSKISVTPLNLADPQAATLDFALALEGQGIDPGINLAPLATLRAGTQQLAAASWEPQSGVLSFPATDLTGVKTITLMIRNLAGAPLRTFSWTLSQ
jgi:hypothetical protein